MKIESQVRFRSAAVRLAYLYILDGVTVKTGNIFAVNSNTSMRNLKLNEILICVALCVFTIVIIQFIPCSTFQTYCQPYSCSLGLHYQSCPSNNLSVILET